MMHMYIHDTLIPKMLEGMSNFKTKANILENYGLTILYQEAVGEWIICRTLSSIKSATMLIPQRCVTGKPLGLE